jgi:predicted metal-dependent phosphoesterase TrpH
MPPFMLIFRTLHALFISPIQHRAMRCDLHLHSTASGMCDTPGFTRLCKESYNEPTAVYDHCKRRGMSIVTLTDHNSIEGGEVLRKHPDFFLSEEVTVQLPSGTQAHLGVYDITEKDHAEIQRRRNDFIALLMYLTERKLFFSVNHVFSALTGQRKEDDFRWFASYVPALEVRNGQMWAQANQAAERLAHNLCKIAIAGSDSHTLAGAALTYTQIPGARTVEEFLTGLRAGRGIIQGEHGCYTKITADIFRFAASLFQEKPWCAPLMPLAMLIPAVTAAHWLNEIRFCKQWMAKLQHREHPSRMLWDVDSGFQANWAN